MKKIIKITLLAGGVGGAKMAEGFAALQNVDLSIIGNIADDDEFHGLRVSPDIDTITYTLSGLINRKQGWGIKNEGLRALNLAAFEMVDYVLIDNHEKPNELIKSLQPNYFANLSKTTEAIIII